MSISMGMTFKDAKAAFFDRPSKNLMTRAQKARKKVLGKFGAYCKQVAKNLIKSAGKKGKKSLPGKPPLYHNGRIRYKDFIFSSYDDSRGSVVIGGVLLGTGNLVPKLLERGGTGYYIARAGGKRIKKFGTWRARPHMRVAFEITVKRMLKTLLHNSIQKES